tara:strand:+ start:4443 stop:5939 length:1497 start_codon:yes stop_codon:yes gene_type:complete
LSTNNNIFNELEILIRSRYPLIYLTSHEENRVISEIIDISKKNKKNLYSWTITSGLIDELATEDDISDLDAFNDPLDILQHINTIDENAIFILKDFHSYLEDFTIIRKLRDLYSSLKLTHKSIILLSPLLTLPKELSKEITVLDIPLPGMNEFKELINDIKSNNSALIELDKNESSTLSRAAHGLTLSEAENVFSKAIVCQRKLTSKGLNFILNEKKQIVRKSGILEFYPTGHNINQLGGFDNLKKWLQERGRALFSQKAKNFGLPSPKGILLLGPPGTGKSLTAKIVSNYWKLPLLKLDFGKIFSGLVGSSEENMRMALKTAEGLSPSVLWVDEIEKGLAGGKSGSSDGGTAARVFGSLLTWMQEKNSMVFVIATANDISKLPPELMRKGRFDEIFFLDLPSDEEREEIFKIHLKKVGRDPSKFDIQLFSKISNEFTGAEIEQSVIDSLFKSFNMKSELKNEYIQKSISECIPLSKTYNKELSALREWAKLRARKAS